MRRLFPPLDTRALRLSSQLCYRPGFPAQYEMHATCSNASDGWADDWTEALVGRNNGNKYDAASSLPASSRLFESVTGPHPALKSSSVPPDSPQHDCVSPGAEPLLLSPPIMHYCTVAERDEWAAVLNYRDLHAGSLELSGCETKFAPPVILTASNECVMDATAISRALEGSESGNAAVAPTAATIPSMEAKKDAEGSNMPGGTTSQDCRCTAEFAVAGTGAAADPSGLLNATVTTAPSVLAPLHPAITTPGSSLTINDSRSGDGLGDAVVLVAIELGSHCTRAVMHDGSSEVARLAYDTMLGQIASPPARGAGGDSNADLDSGALQHTLDVLQQIMDNATAIAEAVPANNATASPPPPVLAVADEQAAMAGSRSEIGDGAMALLSSVVRPRVVVRMVATAAVRNASSGSRAVLAAAAARLTGAPLEVLSGEDEARLAWLGVLCGLPSITLPLGKPATATRGAAAREAVAAAPDPFPEQRQKQQQQHLLVVDMGGRSTELIYGIREAEKPIGVSLPLGCVGLCSMACDLLRSRSPPGALKDAACQTGIGGVEGGNQGCRTGVGGDGGTRQDQLRPEPARGVEEEELTLEVLQACVRHAQETVERLCSGRPWMPSSPSPVSATSPPPSSQAAAAEQRCTGGPKTGKTLASSRGTGGCDRDTDASDAAAIAISISSSLTSVVKMCRTDETAVTVIFTGGTITTLAALHQCLPYYDRARVHGSLLTSYDICALMVRLANDEDKVAVLMSYDWLTEARCRTLPAGCAGLLGVMAALGLEQVMVSDADLLDGLLGDMLDSQDR